jgi:hypothetical protein
MATVDDHPMAYELTPEGDLVPRTRQWVQWLLLLGFFLSLLIGVGALAGLYWLESGVAPEPVSRDPLHALRPADIPPHLALAQLANAPTVPLARQAINANQLELAYATILFDTQLPNSERSGLLLLLGRRFQQAGQPDRAGLVYRLVRPVAVLAPELTPLERSQILVQSAEGLLSTGDARASVETAIQAMLVAAQSPGLLPAQRSQILESLAPILRRSGELARSDVDMIALAQRLADLQRGPNLSPLGAPLVSRWQELSQPVEVDPVVVAAVAHRQEMAQHLADRIAATGGADLEPEREALAVALLAEDQVRAEAYRQQQAAGPALAQQHWLAQERRAWLLLKLRVGLGGFGLRLVPDWESGSETVVQEFAGATDDLVEVLNAQITAQVDPTARTMLQVEVLRWLALQAELGLYPNAPIADLGEQLRVSQIELEQLDSPLALPAVFEPEAIDLHFRLVEEVSR